MNSFTFVAALKKSVQDGVDHELTYLSSQIPPGAPPHLLRFAEWLERQPPADQELAHDLLRYFAEGGLFRVLAYLDNRSQLTDDPGQLELWHVSPDGSKTRINDPDGTLLNDMFNEVQ